MSPPSSRTTKLFKYPASMALERKKLEVTITNLCETSLCQGRIPSSVLIPFIGHLKCLYLEQIMELLLDCT